MSIKLVTIRRMPVSRAWQDAIIEVVALVRAASRRRTHGLANARWQQANRERRRVTARAHYQRNRERMVAKTKAWRIANRDAHNAAARRWAARNPDHKRQWRARQRAQQGAQP